MEDDSTNTTSASSDDLRRMMFGDIADDVPDPSVTVPAGVNDSAVTDADRPLCDATEPASLHLWLSRRVGVGELDHLFRRQGNLVRIIPGAIQPLNAKQLRAEIDYTFRSIKHVKDRGEVDVNFPLVPAENAIGAVHRLNNAREIQGITSIPLFRADGELIDNPGYDSVTKMLYQPEEGLKIHVPEEPTRQALFEAATLIKYPFSQFPFETEADRCNWFGCAFTPLLRYLSPAPYKMVEVGARNSGSGKGFLVGMLRKLHGGTLRGSLPDKESEMKKTITTALLGSEGIIVFDNVRGMVKSASLEALLTAETWSDRLLGGNVDAILPNDRLWMVTGNNVTFGGDMARRVLKIRLDAGPEPEKRTGFQIANPVGWMSNNRGPYLSALMTVIRSWLYAGAQMPAATSSDSYAQWRQMVSGILQHAGLGDEFDATSTQLGMTAEDEEWWVFLHALRSQFGTKPITCREIVDALKFGNDLQDAMPNALAHRWNGFSDASFKSSLTKFLDYKDRTWFRDIMVCKSEKSTRAGYLWTIETSSR
jgi:hypothetical protein